MSHTQSADTTPAADSTAAEAGQQFVGQWNTLISTTNWEKGRIICQWREALQAEGAAVTEYSDEAWANLVGGVTSQHVGRLRRVSQRFGDSIEQYDGLYWSHFQAAIDWDDAEMWLEGAIHNGWSVSQMRGKRWETTGAAGEAPPEDDAAVANGFAAEGITLDEPRDAGADDEAATSTVQEIDSPEAGSAAKSKDKPAASDEDDDEAPFDDGTTAEAGPESAPATAKEKRTRLPVEVDELPDDLAEAFEQFKLAIIAHRREGWSETTPELVVECLDALKQLAEAPLD
ncbi:MAG: hypothetical protein CMJ58_25925 [Planctomycetaceae bacterium]|nr:hypothetical protein [Planctomycetaceae bacterium]